LLPCHGELVQLLNLVAVVLVPLINQLQQDFSQAGVLKEIRSWDSMPVFVAEAEHSNNSRVTPGLASKGCCSLQGYVLLRH
jgi:hypothetical protein